MELIIIFVFCLIKDVYAKNGISFCKYKISKDELDKKLILNGKYTYRFAQQY